RIADIHAGALAHRVQAFENLDGIGAVLGRGSSLFGHENVGSGSAGGQGRGGGSTACLRGANQRVPKSPIYRNFGGKSEPLSPSPSSSRGGCSTRSGDRAERARRSWPRRSNSLAAPTRLRPGGLSHPP